MTTTTSTVGTGTPRFTGSRKTRRRTETMKKKQHCSLPDDSVLRTKQPRKGSQLRPINELSSMAQENLEKPFSVNMCESLDAFEMMMCGQDAKISPEKIGSTNRCHAVLGSHSVGYCEFDEAEENNEGNLPVIVLGDASPCVLTPTRMLRYNDPSDLSDTSAIPFDMPTLNGPSASNTPRPVHTESMPASPLNGGSPFHRSVVELAGRTVSAAESDAARSKRTSVEELERITAVPGWEWEFMDSQVESPKQWSPSHPSQVAAPDPRWKFRVCEKKLRARLEAVAAESRQSKNIAGEGTKRPRASEPRGQVTSEQCRYKSDLYTSSDSSIIAMQTPKRRKTLKAATRTAT